MESVPEGLLDAGWTRISAADESIYRSFFADSADSLSYENTWAFIRQETRVWGYRYHDGDILITATIKQPDSPFILILPPLIRAPDQTNAAVAGRCVKLASSLRRMTHRRVVFRKLPLDWFARAMETGWCVQRYPHEFLCPRDVPEDILPQVIISCPSTLSCQGAAFAKVRHHLNQFRRIHRPRFLPLSTSAEQDVRELVERWNREYTDRVLSSNESGILQLAIDNSAYTIFASEFAGRIDNDRYFAVILYSENTPVGFIFAERVTHESAALYCSVSLTAYKGSSECLMMELLRLLVASGVKWLNLGGAETEGLFKFKCKFDAKALRPSHDAEVVI